MMLNVWQADVRLDGLGVSPSARPRWLLLRAASDDGEVPLRGAQRAGAPR